MTTSEGVPSTNPPRTVRADSLMNVVFWELLSRFDPMQTVSRMRCASLDDHRKRRRVVSKLNPRSSRSPRLPPASSAHRLKKPPDFSATRHLRIPRTIAALAISSPTHCPSQCASRVCSVEVLKTLPEGPAPRTQPGSHMKHGLVSFRAQPDRQPVHVLARASSRLEHTAEEPRTNRPPSGFPPCAAKSGTLEAYQLVPVSQEQMLAIGWNELCWEDNQLRPDASVICLGARNPLRVSEFPVAKHRL